LRLPIRPELVLMWGNGLDCYSVFTKTLKDVENSAPASKTRPEELQI
jgi:hypothetical protein